MENLWDFKAKRQKGAEAMRSCWMSMIRVTTGSYSTA